MSIVQSLWKKNDIRNKENDIKLLKEARLEKECPLSIVHMCLS
jgi:hypothetical protein